MTFKILTDSTSDLPLEWLENTDIQVLGLTITLDGITYETVGENRLTSPVLLEKMLAGGQPTTSQVNVGQFETAFLEAVQEGKDVLYLAFSAALSGTYQSALIARDMVLDQYPDARIELIDTKAASMAEGYLVMQAYEAREAGKTLTEVKDLVKELHPRLRTYLLVDDLNHLVRGGRLSKASALIGGLVNIKPLLAVNRNGGLEAIAKIRGKKKAIREMVQRTLEDLDHSTIILAYTGEKASAEVLRDSLLEEEGIQRVLLTPLGPVIASHTGTGALALISVHKQAR